MDKSADGKDDDLKSDFGRAANQADYAADRGDLVGRIDRVYRNLAEIDGLIDRMAQVLRISQPPMFGKLDIRWWKDRTGSYRDPFGVRWMPTKLKKSKPVVVQRVSLAKHPKFQLNSKVTLRAFSHFKQWAEERNKLRSKIWRMKKMAGQLEGLERQIEEERRFLDGLWYRAAKNLIEDGQVLDADTYEEFRRLEEEE